MPELSSPMTRIEWATERLRRDVLSGELQPGARLQANALAGHWGISPTPIREAFQRLAADGLLEIEPQRGVRVAPLSEDAMRELYALRLLLDPLALRLSLEHRDDVWRVEVEATFVELCRQLEAGAEDLAVLEEAHSAFHAALLSRCDSKWLMRITSMLSERSVRYRLLSLGPRGGPQDVLAEHRALLQACLSDDIDEAVERLYEHIHRTVTAVGSPEVVERVAELLEHTGRQVHTT